MRGNRTEERPLTVVHNSVSLDGTVDGFAVDMGTHYRLASSFGAQAQLVGSMTALRGVELYGPDRGPERPEDRQRPLENGKSPWVIIDTQGQLQGKLHLYRGSEHGDDPVILLSERTAARYRSYLQQRGYRHHVVGPDRVDLRRALALLRAEYGVETLLVDAGPTLVGALINQGLVDRISLLMMPAVVGMDRVGLFDRVKRPLELVLQSQQPEGNGLWVTYQVGSQLD